MCLRDVPTYQLRISASARVVVAQHGGSARVVVGTGGTDWKKASSEERAMQPDVHLLLEQRV